MTPSKERPRRIVHRWGLGLNWDHTRCGIQVMVLSGEPIREIDVMRRLPRKARWCRRCARTRRDKEGG